MTLAFCAWVFCAVVSLTSAAAPRACNNPPPLPNNADPLFNITADNNRDLHAFYTIVSAAPPTTNPLFFQGIPLFDDVSRFYSGVSGAARPVLQSLVESLEVALQLHTEAQYAQGLCDEIYWFAEEYHNTSTDPAQVRAAMSAAVNNFTAFYNAVDENVRHFITFSLTYTQQLEKLQTIYPNLQGEVARTPAATLQLQWLLGNVTTQFNNSCGSDTDSSLCVGLSVSTALLQQQIADLQSFSDIAPQTIQFLNAVGNPLVQVTTFYEQLAGKLVTTSSSAQYGLTKTSSVDISLTLPMVKLQTGVAKGLWAEIQDQMSTLINTACKNINFELNSTTKPPIRVV